MSIVASREQRRALARENARRPLYLEGVRRRHSATRPAQSRLCRGTQRESV